MIINYHDYQLDGGTSLVENGHCLLLLAGGNMIGRVNNVINYANE